MYFKCWTLSVGMLISVSVAPANSGRTMRTSAVAGNVAPTVRVPGAGARAKAPPAQTPCAECTIRNMEIRLGGASLVPSWARGETTVTARDVTGLASVVWAHQEGDFKKCVKGAVVAGPLKPFVHRRVIMCASALIESGGESGGGAVDAEPAVRELMSYLGVAPPGVAGLLRKDLVRYLRLRLPDLIKSDRKKAWRWAEWLLDHDDDSSAAERAEHLRWAGELAMLSQQWLVALGLFERSQKLSDSKSVGEVLAKVRRELGVTPDPGLERAATDLEAVGSEDEKKLYRRVTDAWSQGQVLAGLDDALRLFKDYPHSRRAALVQDKVLEQLMNSLSVEGEKRIELTQKYLGVMQKAHPSRRLEWAKKLLTRGYALESAQVIDSAWEGLSEGAAALQALEVGLRSNWYAGQLRHLQTITTLVRERAAGTSLAAEAAWIEGMSELMAGRPREAVGALELAQSMGVLPASAEISVRYWLWRAWRSVDPVLAEPHGKWLLESAPFSYFGIRVRAELSGGDSWEWDLPHVPKLSASVPLTENERKMFGLAESLARQGAVEEAHVLARQLPVPVSPVPKALWGAWLADLGDHARASQLIHEAWDVQPALRSRELLQRIYPTVWERPMSQAASQSRVPLALVRALTRQESAYNPVAVSSSGALGLMQLMPATAKDVSSRLPQLGPLRIPMDVFRPQTNTQLGARYISEMIQRFQGHVPLALAAYNAGPTRMARWLDAHPQWKDLATDRQPDPLREIWMEQIPWAETRGYVRSILRNVFLQELTAQSRVRWAQPPWTALAVPAEAPNGK